MIARLYCRTGSLAGTEYHVGDEAVIGRQEGTDITLASDAVSDRHARLFYDDEQECYVLEDLDSGRGTQVDATEVVDAVPMRDLHVITFGESVDVIFQAVDEQMASAEASHTQFGMPPEKPSDLSREDEGDGERTRMGGPADLPDLSDEDDQTGEQTRFDESPAELPDLSEEGDAEEADPEHTQFGQAPSAPSDLSGEDADTDDPDSSASDVEHTRFGESPPQLPDLSEGAEPGGDQTRMGEPPESLPDLSDEDAGSETEDTPSSGVEQTRFGESAPDLPDFSEEDSDEDDAEGDRTRMAEEPGALPDLSGQDSPETDGPVSEEDDDSSTREGNVEDDVEQTQMGAAAPDLPDVSEDEASSEDDVEDLSEAPTQAAPDQDAPSTKSSPQYALRVLLDDEPQDTYPLPEGEVTIGRSPECDIQVEDPGVSREHARLVVDAGELTVEDMGSKNFTFVDGNRLSGPTTLSQGSQLQFGLHVKAVVHRVPS